MFVYFISTLITSDYMDHHTLVIYIFCTAVITNIDSVSIAQGVPNSCPNGYYRIRNGCRVCPPGFTGENCSKPCPGYQYGLLCRQTCHCSPSECNPKDGCSEASTLQTVYVNKASTMQTLYVDKETTVHSTYETEADDHDSQSVNTKTIIILVSSIIYTVLVFLIIYELRKYRHFCLTHTSPKITTNTECVYAEANEVNLDVIENDETI